MTTAFVFPGQGSQQVGMLQKVAGHAIVKNTIAQANQALDFDLGQLIAEGPKEKLDQTQNTQPAILTASVAMWRLWQEKGAVDAPVCLAGHSLGEYSALVCAGSIDLSDAVRLVALRGKLMQEAVPVGVGAMAAILGLSDEAVRDACAAAAENQIAAAVNFNAPGQVVIAGHKEAVNRACAKAKELGAKRAMLLPVSVPSHCALMLPAAEKLASVLQDIAIQPPIIPVLHDVDAKPTMDLAQIRNNLVRQLHCPVLWVDIVQQMVAQGVTKVVECGPGNVLTGLNKRIDGNLQLVSIQEYFA